MKKHLALAAVLLAAPFVHAGNPALDMGRAARNFLKGLDAKQKAKAFFKFTDEERENWHFIPLDRKGIMLSELNPEQTHYAYALLASGLSQKGVLNASTIMSLEAILAEMEKDPVRRDTQKYYIAIFGEPSSKQQTGTWGWRFEGHHLSLNYTVINGNVVITPAFLGTNPASVKKGPRKGTRPLGRMEDQARALMKSLKEAGKPVILSDKAPRDILSSQDRVAAKPESLGVKGGDMTAEQKKLLLAILREFASNARPELARPAMNEIAGAVDTLQFAWAGGLNKGDQHYFRVTDNGAFMVEYANTQNDANHAHAVWRLFDGDFGRDVLKEHLEKEHSKDR
ncbi:MAG: hypothetical protein CMN05_09525 [Roseibacillus sp.]|jgi:hypothetical protein|nr:hypothetical protein [Roseibacillus sp.]MCP4730621.1 DUF3500 domain-containing protein [Roseibacillus sp.]MDP7306390.1 DUF3500 domain-containing protein [Roseibacillus sp.]MDP7656000.1 DUF3500 domain-containing protein [Roseibacillus sp.]HJM64884.1 DUF3500 domain-containing protein [Roseibacillus sp.]|tara:strand:- start:17646 stop:18665 length:1020 start_codon:yes stop_codon:yes gene_type:complete